MIFANDEKVYKAAFEAVKEALMANVPKDGLREWEANRLIGAISGICSMVHHLKDEGE